MVKEWPKLDNDLEKFAKKMEVDDKDGQMFCLLIQAPCNRIKIFFFSRVAPDTELAGYPANLFCRISG